MQAGLHAFVCMHIYSTGVRAVRKVHELLELFTQSKFGDTDSTGDAED